MQYDELRDDTKINNAEEFFLTYLPENIQYTLMYTNIYNQYNIKILFFRKNEIHCLFVIYVSNE